MTAKAKTPPESAPAQPLHEIRTPPPKVFKPEVRIQAAPPPPPPSAPGKGGIQWIPWSELSGGQRAGRLLAALVVVFIVFSFTRTVLRGLVTTGGSSTGAPTAESSDVPMSDGDRRDGIESLCRVFQIYGMPKNDKDADESVRNAAELFKLGGNQSPERSLFILKAIARQFRAGTLGAPDCTQVGAAIGSSTDNADTPSAGPTR
ncbi:MAG TPA: hypothetical protein VEU51_06825 [Candidatus Acidoferrales bacterium]|nr:hypothetical protein [Candidatus Acidoferrales bacterium]